MSLQLNVAAAELQQLYNELPVDEEATRSQQEQPLSGICNAALHDEDNSSHIDSCTSNISISQHHSAETISANQIVSKGFVKNYALMFQQQQPKDTATATSVTATASAAAVVSSLPGGPPSSSTSSSYGSKKINEYLAKFESKTDDKQKKLIDQLSKLNEECLLLTYNQTNVSSVGECVKTRDLFNLFYLDEATASKSPALYS